MSASKRVLIGGLAVLGVLIGTPALAQQILFDWGPNCFGWETDYNGHISNPGSELTMLGVIDIFYEPLEFLDPDTMEYTFVFEGLVSMGTVDIGGIIFETEYGPGTFKIYEDATPDFEFGVNPPNDTAPASFMDGELIMEGTLTDFSVTIIDDGSYPGAVGNVNANWEITGGSLYEQLMGCYGPMLGTWTDDDNVAPIPEGYTSHCDGKFDHDCPPTPVESETWGRIKKQFQ